VIATQWNDASLDCVTTMSTISYFACVSIHFETSSPRCALSASIVAENTFTPLNLPALGDRGSTTVPR
jgi:hypothetical protein